MLIFLRIRQFAGILKGWAKWLVPVLILIALYAATICILPVLEGPDSPFVSRWTATWWLCVTLTTVGYGDVSPATTGGQIFAIVAMVVGIGTAALLLTEGLGCLIQMAINKAQKKRRGLVQLRKKDHVLIVGYVPGETQIMVEQLRVGGYTDIVLCTTESENPLPGVVEYVQGKIPSKDVFQRAGVRQARLVAIYTGNDAMSMSAAMALLKYHTEFGVEIRAHVSNQEQASLIRELYEGQSGHIETIVSLSALLMVQDLGVPETVRELTSHLDGEDEFYTIEVSGVWGMGKLFNLLKQYYNVTIVGVINAKGVRDSNPPVNTPIGDGEKLIVITPERPEIDWDRLLAEN